jgi:sialate O-acetylesterase
VISPALQGRFSAVGYYFARDLHRRLQVPIGLIDTSTPATGIESWMSDAAAAAVYGAALHQGPGRFPDTMGDPSLFYNGKVAPVMPFAIAGMIWYQADAGPAAYGYRYRDYLPALIQDWRRGFGQGNVPFLVVQIPAYEGTSPEVRESQLLTALRGHDIGLAVTIDTGDPTDIHPRNKRPVGERLALIARAMAYGEAVEYLGPIYRRMAVVGGKVTLSFDHVGGGLVLKGSGGFEVCGADGVYVPAHAALAGDSQVAVWSDAVAWPVAVRYAWASVPEVTLFSKADLPASPFRTADPDVPR